MSKKGVSAVSGITAPTAGKKEIYNIVNWYPATPQIDRNPSKVTWELFKKRRNGKFTTTNIRKKGISDFTFGEGSVGETYRLEAYLYSPEGGGLIIKPKPSKIPRINKVELFYVDDTKGILFNFNESLRARATCVNMLGKELIFTLWEDDAYGGGHNAKNMVIDSKPAKVNINGLATVDFSLNTALMLKAARNEGDTQLEFYVTVEYFKNKRHATNNVNIKNPFPPEKAKSKSDNKSIPKAKGSPAENKPNSKKEESGISKIVTDIKKELWDWYEIKGTATKEKPPTVEKSDGKSTAEENGKDIPQSEVCKCEEFDLIWGKKVDCKFRQKVVAIAKDLWPSDYKVMANNLMAVFAWETGETFKPDVPNRAGSGATGLIQFMPERADEYFGKHTLENVPNYFNSTNPKLHNLPRVKEFASMKAIDQLDYVAKYFETLRNKKLEFVDFYLQVLFPVSSQKGEHFVFGKEEFRNIIGLPEDSKAVRQKRIDKYAKNSGMDIFADGKISRSEIALSIQPFITKGQPEIFRRGQKKEENKQETVSETIVVTDAGHGIGGDSGAKITADTEAIMTLEVETKTAQNLVNLGIKNVRTRTAPLPSQSVDQVTYRANVFKNNKAKVMVSHHLNSVGETFLIMYHPAKLSILKDPKNPKKGYQSTTGGSSADFLKNSLALANAIMIEVKALGIESVLREATVPNINYSSLGILRSIDGAENAGVLIEMGSVSAVNTKFLRTNADGIGKAIATGIANYLKVPVSQKSSSIIDMCEEASEIAPVKSNAVKTEAVECKEGICEYFEDVVPNPKLNTQGVKNKNRFHGVPRVKIKNINGKNVTTTYYHGATDILATVGTDIHSLTCGEVVHIRTDLPQNDRVKGYESATSYGNTIMVKSNIKDLGIVYFFYAHLSKVDVKVNQKVNHGSILGKTGSTGNAMHVDTSVRHVHIEAGTEISATTGIKAMIIKSSRIDPEQFMKTKFDKNGDAITENK